MEGLADIVFSLEIYFKRKYTCQKKDAGVKNKSFPIGSHLTLWASNQNRENKNYKSASYLM